MKAFSRPETNLVRCSTSRDRASRPLGLILLTSSDRGRAYGTVSSLLGVTFKKNIETYEDLACGVAEGIEVDELLDLARQA